MAAVVAVIGESARGKTASLARMNPADVLLVQVVDKMLPFENARNWVRYDKERAPHGNVFVCDSPELITKLISSTRRPIIVIDDWQYTMSNEFMRRHGEKGYDKFTEIAYKAWMLLSAAHALPANKRVYILTHTETKDDGTVQMKTIGRMLNEKMTIEGQFTTVLRAMVRADEEEPEKRYVFSTRTNGLDPVKSPIGMFAGAFIPNDLAAVDERVCEYYGINDGGKE